MHLCVLRYLLLRSAKQPPQLKGVLGLFKVALLPVSMGEYMLKIIQPKHITALPYCDSGILYTSNNFMIVPKNGTILVIQISLYQFIYSQSPNSMKGFLIGLSFAISGILQTLLYGILAVVLQVQTSPQLWKQLLLFMCLSGTYKFFDIHLYCKKSVSEKGQHMSSSPIC